MLPRIVDAHYVSGFKIRIRFSDGVEGDVDLSRELMGPIFEPLRDVQAFKRFRLHPELRTLHAATIRSTISRAIRVITGQLGTLIGNRFFWMSLLLTSYTALASAAALKVGDVPPDVFGKASTGEAIRLNDFRGRIVIISFWATWCGPCRKELPMLIAVQKQATREKVVVLSVNWRQGDEFRQIKRIFKDQGTDVTLISDERGRAADAYGVKGIPHMIIVGRDGKIAAIHVGYSEQQLPILVDEINSALDKPTSDSQSPN